jgi:hypothetical protein
MQRVFSLITVYCSLKNPHFPKKSKAQGFRENISLPPSARLSIVGYYARKLLSNLGRISI